MSYTPNDTTMEALVWLGPHRMVVRSEPVPQLMPGDVLIEMNAVGICGSELSGYLGHNSLRRPPLIMGHEAAGRVVQTTDGLFADGSTPQAGMRVTFNPLVVCNECDRCRAGRINLCRKRQIIGAHRPGAFARYVAVPAQQCWSVPDDLSTVAASLTEPLACAVHAVALSNVQPEQSLLILGAGPIGLCCLAAAHAVGVENIIMTDVSPQRLATAQQWGARSTINAREGDVVAMIQEAFPGGVDTVIDAVGTTAVRTQAIETVVPGGNVVFIGLHEEDSLLPANYIVRQEVSIIGSFSYANDDFKQALDLLAQGVIRPSPDWLVERPLHEGPASFAELVAGNTDATKIVLTGESV